MLQDVTALQMSAFIGFLLVYGVVANVGFLEWKKAYDQDSFEGHFPLIEVLVLTLFAAGLSVATVLTFFN